MIGLRNIFSIVTLCIILLYVHHGETGRGPKETSGSVCSSAIQKTFLGAFDGVTWAVEMADACGKPQTGMLRQGFELQSSLPDVPRDAIRLVGNPDQCLHVQVPETFQTQYCTARLQVTKLGLANFSVPKEVFLGVCVPDVCTETDLIHALTPYLSKIPFVTARTTDVFCQEKERALDRKAVGALSVLTVILALVVLGTLYDLVFVESGEKDIGKKTPDGETSRTGNAVSHAKHDSPNERGTLCRCLVAFSVRSNIRQLFSDKAEKSPLDFLEGMKLMTTLWLVFGHTLLEGHNMTENFLHELEEGKEKPEGPIVNCFNFASDAFLAISGFLVVYHTLKRLQTQKPSFAFFREVITNHYWRLTPHYALVMLIYVSLFKYAVDGPLVTRAPIEVNECEHNWWANVLYVNFLYPVDQCMLWTWYLSCDMIYHVISPVIVVAFVYYGWGGVIVPISMIIGSSALSGYISFTNDLFAFRNDNPDYTAYFNHYYPHPYTRIGPFLVGTIVAYMVYKHEGKSAMPKGCKLFGWATSMALTLTVFGTCYYSQAIRSLTTMEAAVANAVFRTMFAVASSWVIYVCALGQGGGVEKFLTWSPFKTLFKVSYGVDLLHPIVIRFYFRSSRRLVFFNQTFLIFFLQGLLVITFIVSIVTTLLFEIPFLNLRDILFRGKNKDKVMKAE